MPNKAQNSKSIIYQARSGAIELRGDFQHETIWATQTQIALAFDVSVKTINEHIQNIFKTQELLEKSTIRKFRIVQKEGSREIARNVKHYNLDVILSTGYRVNSKKATQFRQWATKTLRKYIISGFVIDKKKVAKNYDKFSTTIAEIKKLLPANTNIDPQDVISLISSFAETWLSLEAYDKNALVTGKLTKKKVELTTEKIIENLSAFKSQLMTKDQAFEVFAIERSSGVLAGIVGNVMQSFGGNDLYESLEEKAAHLLYFIIKNHPFIDGNKRSGAFIFIWFLRQASLLNESKLTASTLTALAILVASSTPKDKDKIVQLILNLI